MATILSGLWGMIWGKLHPPADPTTSFAGKTVLLTGANVGLGFEAAIKFVSLGAKTVIMGVRSVDKGKDAKAAIEAKTGRHDGDDVIKVWQLDMNSYASIKAFAERVNREVVGRLDVAELNAGLMNTSYKQSPEGWEETLQVNVLSTTLLALLLLPKLRASRTETETGTETSTDTPHLAFVSSGTHRRVKPASVLVDGSVLAHLNSSSSSPDPNDGTTSFAGQQQYAISKLFVEYVMREIAALAHKGREKEDDDPSRQQPEVIVNSLCPGFCKSALGRSYDQHPIVRIGKTIFYGIFARSTEEGSRTLVSAVTQGKESHGRWWRDDGYPESGPLVTSEEGKKLRKKVWKEILEALRGVSPEVDRLVLGATNVSA